MHTPEHLQLAWTRYAPLRVLGRGGMGVVYLVQRRSDGARCALKTTLDPRAQLAHSLLREIDALAALAHPHIVPIVDHGVDRGSPWYVMPFLDGPSLRQHLHAAAHPRPVVTDAAHASEARTTPTDVTDPTGFTGFTDAAAVALMSLATAPPNPHASGGHTLSPARPLRAGWRDALTPMVAVCSALAHLHSRGMVHGDLKPENIILHNDQPVLVDLGLVKHLSSAATGRDLLDTPHLRAGTPSYRAPEQRRADAVDARADLYALGSVLHELLWGAPAPHPCALPTSASALPEALRDLLTRLLDPDPRRRPGYAADVAHTLAPICGQPLPSLPAQLHLHRPRSVGQDDALAHALDQLYGEPRRAALVGGMGQGKTRALRSLALRWAQAGRPVLPLRFDEVRPNQPFALVLALVRAALPHLPALTDDQRVLLRPHLQRLAVLEPRVLRWCPWLAPADPAPRPLRVSQVAAFVALEQLLRHTIADRPDLLVLLDDAHGLDPASRAWLDHAHTHDLWRWAVSLRADALDSGWRAWPSALLPRLTDDQAHALIQSALASDAPPRALVAYVTRQAEGNPYAIAEYLRAGIQTGLLTRRAGRWVASPSLHDEALHDDLPLPDRLTGLLRRRLSALPEPLQRTLAVIALAETHASEALLARVAPHAPTSDHVRQLIDRALVETRHDAPTPALLEGLSAQRASLLEVSAQAPAPHLALTHRALAHVALDLLPDATVRALHALVADAIQGDAFNDQLARGIHWARAGHPDRALHHLGPFLQEHVSSVLYTRAAAQLCLDLDLARSPHERIRHLTLLARSFNHLNQLDTSLALNDALLDTARALDDPAAVAVAWLQRVRICTLLNDQDAIADALARAQALLDRDDDDAVRAEHHILSGSHLHRLGQLDRALDHFTQAATLSRACQRDDLLAWAKLCLGIWHGRHGADQDAVDALEQAQRLYADLGDLTNAARAVVSLGVMAFFDGRYARAVDLFMRACDLYERSGELPNKGLALANAAHACVFVGRPGRALELAQRALDLFDATRTRLYPATAANGRTAALIALDRLDDAAQANADAFASCAAHPNPSELLGAHHARAVIALRRGDLDSALDDFAQAHASPSANHRTRILLHLDHADALRRHAPDRIADARDLLSHARDALDTIGRPPFLALLTDAVDALVVHAGGDHDLAQQRAQQVLDRLDGRVNLSLHAATDDLKAHLWRLVADA